MAKLFVSGVAPRQYNAQAPTIAPSSVLDLFGCPPVPGHWSGLYGTSSTREGLKRLLVSAKEATSIFRVICKVPGGIVTSMGYEDLGSLGYLNVRYADAELLARIEHCWCSLTGLDDPREAVQTRPDRAVEVVKHIKAQGVLLIIHPFRPPDSELILNAATVLDPSCVVDIRSRDPYLSLALP